MAEENDGAEGTAATADSVEAPPIKCPDCAPGLPAWMATFADLVTLLLTFFVLLLSFAKTESAKYEAALGSIRNAFGGNVLKHGEVIQRGKSPDDSPTMLESQEPIKPFPIDFLTMEGILDKHEINRESDEDLDQMRGDLREFSLSGSAEIYEMNEGIKVKIKDKIYFEEGSTVPSEIVVEVYDRLVKLLSSKKWNINVIGYTSRGELGKGGRDSYQLSADRALAVSKSLIKRGVPPVNITTTFFGDTRPNKIIGNRKNEDKVKDRRVEFILRKRDITTEGHKVNAR